MATRRHFLSISLAGLLGLAGCARERAGTSVPEDAVPHGAEAGESIDDVLSRWRSERDENEPFGLPATTRLDGDDLVVNAEDASARATVEGPCTLTSDDPIDGGMVLSAVTVDGESADSVVIVGSSLEVSDGTLSGFAVEQVACTDPLALYVEEAPLREEPEFPEPPENASSDSAPPSTSYVGGTLESVEIDGFEEAYAIRDGERTDLAGPITVDAGEIWMGRKTVVEAGSATVETDQFSVSAPEGASGKIEIDDREDVDDPYGLFGTDATLAVEPGRIDADGSFRLTQAITEDGFTLDSIVDVLPATTSIEIPAGEEAWIDAYYRERSYVGDGVLEDVTVESPYDDLVEFPLKPPKWIVQEVIEDIDSAAETIAIGLMVPALVALALGEGIAKFIDCVVSDCPEERPYPSWIDAGSVGKFYYRVNAANLDPGTYEATVHVEGANYDGFEIPVEVTVTEPSTPGQ